MDMSLELERQAILNERQRLNHHSPANISKGKQDYIPSKYTKECLNFEISDTIAALPPINNKNDDMEQWVSDTFYSYFPGFNNEYQKRQLYLQRRLRENQENLIKHQILNAGQSSKGKLSKHTIEFNNPNAKTAAASGQSNNSTITSNDTVTSHECSDANKELVNVKNPNYISCNHAVNSARPGSTRYKLLQDLRHTNLSNLAAGNEDNVMNLNEKHVKIESARKKEYQRELMQQIEEKRRSIQFLKEKERQQDEVLTRRLQEQLKTIKLEEKLENERIKATKIRFTAEQNRSMREHILAKLENDSKLLQVDWNTSSLDEKINKENMANLNDENKVYKYFSNSEKNEYNYRKKTFIPADIGEVINQINFPKIERECFHISENICPMCDGPLKEFPDFCIHCQNRISVPVKMPSCPKNEDTYGKPKTHWSHHDKTEKFKANANGSEGSYFLVCIKCERFYSTCSTCLNKSDVCRACQNKLNVCMNCRRSLCSFCLEEVACGKNSENSHINESDSLETPFQVITNGGDSENVDINKSTCRDETINLSVNNLSINDGIHSYQQKIGDDTIVRPDQKLNDLFIYSKPNNLDLEAPQHFVNSFENDYMENFRDNSQEDIVKLRQQTDLALTRYFTNYGEFAVKSRGTQTTPNTNARRDIVLNGENSLSIPLLREMPKMRRRETTNSKKHYSHDLENLQRRWDIPAVQKLTVSPTSPKIVTQIGAIRKQLQADTFFFDGRDRDIL